MTVYEKVIAAGLDYDSHASDLYVPVCPESERIVAEYEFSCNVTLFRSPIDGKVWFDIPFANDPWWTAHKRND